MPTNIYIGHNIIFRICFAPTLGPAAAFVAERQVVQEIDSALNTFAYTQAVPPTIRDWRM